MNFFTAAPHFLNDRTLLRENRPFQNSMEFKDSVLRLWNSQVNKDDTIYCLGDWVNYNKDDTTSWESSIKLPTQLKCPIILIIGNNEERVIFNKFDNSFTCFKTYAINSGFKDVFQEKYLTMRLKTFYLNHYQRNHKDNCINLFGYTHRWTGLYKPYGLNVGCDLNHFQLFSENEIFRLLQEKESHRDLDWII